MSALRPMQPEAAQGAEMEALELDLDCPDSVFRAILLTTSTADETFAEELLRDAFLPKDGVP